MTKRSARKLVRQYADQLNARHADGEGVNTSSAERAYGIVQRKLAEAGVELSMDERLALMAYAHGYVTATTGVEEARGHDLERFADHHAAGEKAGK